MRKSNRSSSRPNRGLTGLRARGQTSGDQLVAIMLAIVVAAALGFIGTDVTAELDSNTDVGALNGENVTVENETTDTIVFDNNDEFRYTVDDANRGATFFDDERAFNSSDAELTEGTDYTFTTSNATFKFINTSSIDNNTQANVTYNYTEKNNDFADAQNNLSSGFASAMSLTDVAFLVLMFSVVLAALVAVRRRS